LILKSGETITVPIAIIKVNNIIKNHNNRKINLLAELKPKSYLRLGLALLLILFAGKFVVKDA